MLFEMVFNDLSLRTPASETAIAQQWMSQFVDTIRQSVSLGVPRVLRTASGFRESVLSHGYTIRRWTADRSVDPDRRRYFLALVTRSPYVDDVLEPNLPDAYHDADFRFGDDLAQGLGVAYILGGFAISFPSAEHWDLAQVPLSVMTLDDSTGEIIVQEVSIFHASRPQHALENSAWITSRREVEIRNGEDLVARRDLFYPSLVFCESALNQLAPLNANNTTLRIAIQGLFELQDYCQRWIDGPFDARRLNNCSNESASTIQQYGAYFSLSRRRTEVVLVALETAESENSLFSTGPTTPNNCRLRW